MNQQQRGGTFLGLIIGVVLGLGAALAVAVYVTKVPVPFMSKNQSRTPDQDAAETRKNQNWDPNAPLYGKNPARPAAPTAPSEPAASSQGPSAAQPPVERAVVAPSGAVPPPRSGDPLGDLAAARGASAGGDPFLYFVQAGAFRTPEDAETQRAKLSLMGLEARVTAREQSGRPVYRVRIGPFERRDDADRNRSRLESGGFEAALVRVQR